MKNLALIFLAAIGIFSMCAFKAIKANFTGAWETATQIDSGADTAEITIKGIIKQGIATVVFKSGYANTTGIATIKLAENKLEWTITREPKGEYYIPKHAILTRDKNK